MAEWTKSGRNDPAAAKLDGLMSLLLAGCRQESHACVGQGRTDLS